MTRLTRTSTSIVLRRITPIAALTALVTGMLTLGALACGGAGEESGETMQGQTVQTLTKCGSVPPELEGSWVLTLDPGDVTPEAHDIQVGHWQMTFGPGKAHSITAPMGNTFSYGPVCVDDELIRFADETPAGGACSGWGTALYIWRVTGDELSLEKVRDRCVYRALPNTLRAWTRESER